MLLDDADHDAGFSTWRTRRQLELLESYSRKDDETFSFAVIGDAEPGRFLWERVLFGKRGTFFKQLRSLCREDVDFVLQMGDMVSRGLHSHYARFLRQLEVNCPERPYLTVMGNHDRHYPHGRSDSLVYRAHFGAPNYFFDRGSARFVVLDTSQGHLTRAQLRWLELVLTTDKLKLVFTHMPPAGLRRWTLGGLGGFKGRSREFMSLMSRKGVERVYMGHVHGFGHRVVDGVTYVLTGGGGSPLYPSLAPHRFYHFLLVDVGPEGVRETVQKLDGERFVLENGAANRAPQAWDWGLVGHQLGLKFLGALALLGFLFAGQA